MAWGAGRRDLTPNPLSREARGLFVCSGEVSHLARYP